MPYKIFEFKVKNRITKFALSNDWYTCTPWQHHDQVLPYLFNYIREISDSGCVNFTYIYIGPFAIISGKWIGDTQ